MHFQINRHMGLTAAPPHEKELFSWTLMKTDGECVAMAAKVFDSEREARSDIAAAKKSMRAAGRCKVFSPEIRTTSGSDSGGNS